MNLLILKRSYPELARAEAKALSTGETEIIEDLFIGACQLDRLSQAKKGLEFLFRCNEQDLTEALSSFDWARAVTPPFRVRSKDIDERSTSSVIWNSLPNPSVDLENPATTIEFFRRGKEVFAGKLIFDYHEPKERYPHARPFFHPTTTSPGIARCMVNLTCASSGRITDPFCGSGGILIEAGLMGFEISGSDIDPVMVDGCRKNLAHYGISGTITTKDAFGITRKIEHLVCDLPYFLNTKGKKEDREEFYKMAFALIDRLATTSCCIGMPTDVRIPQISMKNEGYVIPIHGSLGKRILVFQR